jgi:hypothetical protein
MKWYTENNVNVVPKCCNPLNCPELRGIERYWAIMKRKLKLVEMEEMLKISKKIRRMFPVGCMHQEKSWKILYSCKLKLFFSR